MTDTYDSITLSYTESKHIILAVYYQINWPKKGKEPSMKEKSQLITFMRNRTSFRRARENPMCENGQRNLRGGVLGRLLAIMGKNKECCY